MANILAGSYGASIDHSTFNVNTTYQTVTGSRGFDILTRAVAPTAFHNSDDRPDPPKCHENTRVAVIKRIMDWVTGKIDTEAFMLWMYGPAGAGKSAIARSVAQLCEAQNLLLASFLFFRPNPRRNTMDPLVATLAYQIGLVVPAARAHIEPVVEAHPLILSYSRERLEEQFIKLIFEPLRLLSEQGHFSQNPLPPLIVIDGLDEGVQTTLVRVLFSLASRYQLPLKFLIASRPEVHIKPAFEAISPVSHLELNDDFSPDEDIQLFLRDKFQEIKTCHPFRSHISSDWPNERTLYDLVYKASGQFIYASLAARFVDSPRHLPTQRLEILLDICPSTNRDLPFAELDNLYTWLLSRVEDPPLVLQILGVCITLRERHSSAFIHIIEFIIGLEGGQLVFALADLGSILQCDQNKIAFHHRSFEDFLLNPQRSKDYYIDAHKGHTAIAQRVLQACRRTSAMPILDSETRSVIYKIRLENHLALSYASPELEDDLNHFSFGLYAHEYAIACSFRTPKNQDILKRMLWKPFRLLKYLKENDNKFDLYHHYSEDFTNHIISWFEGCSCPERFHLLSTMWFACYTAPRSRLGCTETFLHSSIIESGTSQWKNLCASLLGFSISDLNWEDNYYRFLHYTAYTLNSSQKIMASSTMIDCLHGGLPVFMGRLAPEHILSDRLTHVAIACIQYLHRRCSGRKTRQTLRQLTVFARKSRLSPWLWRQRTRGATAQPIRRMRYLETYRSSPYQSLYRVQETICFKTHYMQPGVVRKMYRWTLEILDGALRKGGKSDELTNILSTTIELWPLSVFFPCRVRRIKRAIAIYMDKVGPQAESPEGNEAGLEGDLQYEEDGDRFEELSDEEYFSCPESS
ncbi:unnamed protein product [Cyclocybe aegerita]|uniref:Nephrocystin 3-like N-terminal domain-containing protein n=1 Tax=Cyclocybe aegerita TaxID=1973307 RepID=A0A8S0W004_CYCAE|nr:unnamed protein product [Cyclocybe aegerita]